jgi:hypothetical protein
MLQGLRRYRGPLRSQGSRAAVGKKGMNFIPVELNIYVPYPSFFPFFHLPEYISPFIYFITPSPFFSPFSQYP